ncbi:hypothetical protein ACFXAZ_34055 [Streptomyces sp. NPDC059477]|uniref:hypothetical protein n=1 Tax=Streptomyces sp. NPDC059477 TaxID=3346847 RepID=UPI003697AD27
MADAGEDRDYPVIASPDGNYMAAGPVVFDLQRGEGICLAGDGNRKTIALASIRDDGTAYGAVQEESAASGTEAVVAELDLTTSTGEPEVLGQGCGRPLPHQRERVGPVPSGGESRTAPRWLVVRPLPSRHGRSLGLRDRGVA